MLDRSFPHPTTITTTFVTSASSKPWTQLTCAPALSWGMWAVSLKLDGRIGDGEGGKQRGTQAMGGPGSASRNGPGLLSWPLFAHSFSLSDLLTRCFQYIHANPASPLASKTDERLGRASQHDIWNTARATSPQPPCRAMRTWSDPTTNLPITNVATPTANVSSPPPRWRACCLLWGEMSEWEQT